MKTKTQLRKKKTRAFGKDVYLLGKNEYGELLWLEAPSWDCSWYWGFGYVEIYTNQANPSQARDITSHSHFNSLVGFKREDNTYVHHLNESPRMSATVLADKESWELCDLMKSFYTLKDAAEIYHTGNSHLTTTGISLKSSEAEKRINEVDIPAITKRVLEILTPAEGKEQSK